MMPLNQCQARSLLQTRFTTTPKNNQTAQAGVAVSTNKPSKRLACTHTELAPSPRKIALALAAAIKNPAMDSMLTMRTTRPLLTLFSSGALQVDECGCGSLTHMCVAVFECEFKLAHLPAACVSLLGLDYQQKGMRPICLSVSHHAS